MIDEEVKLKIWEKMPSAEGKDQKKYKLDACGALIEYERYGDRQNDYGWEVDHVVPKSLLQNKGVPEDEIDAEENLRPMQWANNDAKSTDYPEYQSKIRYENGKNVEVIGVYEVNKELQKILSNKYSKYGI